MAGMSEELQRRLRANADLPRRMREAADTLAEANRLYGMNPEWGVWNPVSLRKEADVVASEVSHAE